MGFAAELMMGEVSSQTSILNNSKCLHFYVKLKQVYDAIKVNYNEF